MCLACLNFLIDLSFSWFVQKKGEGRSDGTLIEWERDVDVLVGILSPIILVEKSVVKLRPSEAAVQG